LLSPLSLHDALPISLRALLFQREAAVRRLLLGLGVLSVGLAVRPSHAQDTSAVDRGVRIGIIYRPGVRPGMVVLPVHAPALDSRSEEHTSELQSPYD